MADAGPVKGKQKDDGHTEDKSNGKKTAKQTPRKRVSQACDTCRSRKDRCDGERPACSTCVQNGRDCSYNANVKKRGLPEGYVRGMEKLWGLAVKEVEDVEEELLAALGDENQQRTVWNDESNSENLVDIWRKSQIFSGLERLLSSLAIEPPETAKRKRVDSVTNPVKNAAPKNVPSGLTPPTQDDWAGNGFMEGIMDMHSASMTAASPVAQPSSTQPESILNPADTTFRKDPTTMSMPLSGVPELPSETWHLLDVYFSYTHSWLPIVEKHDLLRISYQYSQNRPTASTSGSGDNAILWAAIAYAKFQHRAINNIPRALGSVGDMVWTAERMYSQARAFIPNEEGSLELGHVQALLILTLANVGTDHLDRAWFLVGQAVRASIQLGLGQPLEHMLATSKSRSRMKHVFLGCFVLDTMVAARLGRRPQLRSAEVDVVGLLEEDGLEEWDPWTDCLNVRKSGTGNARSPAAILSTFNNLVKVFHVLNDTICITTNDSNASIDSSVNLVQKLQAWAQEQPTSTYFDLGTAYTVPSSPLLPHHYQLHAAYSTTLSMCRLLSSNDNDSIEQATKSARRTADVLSQYSNTFGLLIAPPTFEYYIKTAYDVVGTVQSSMDSAQFQINDWRRNLDYCLEMIEPAWPVLETFRASVSSSPTLQRSESQTLYSSNNGLARDAEGSVQGKTPQSVQSYGSVSHPSPRPDLQQNSQLVASSKFPSTPSQSRSSFGKTSTHGLPQNPLSIYENAHATFGMRNTSVTQNREAQFTAAAQAMARNNPQYNPQLRSSMSAGSEVDMLGEPVFSDLMRLDATEWYVLP